MILDVVDPVFEVSVPFGEVNLKQIPEQVLEVGTEVRREPDSAADDLLVDLNGLIGEERRITGGHLVHQNAQGPPIHGLVVPFAQNDLGREVLRGAAEGPRATLHPFGEPEVGDLQVALAVDQQVLRLQVPVNEVQIVQIFEREHDLSRVKPGMSLTANTRHFSSLVQ